MVSTKLCQEPEGSAVQLESRDKSHSVEQMLHVYVLYSFGLALSEKFVVRVL